MVCLECPLCPTITVPVDAPVNLYTVYANSEYYATQYLKEHIKKRHG